MRKEVSLLREKMEQQKNESNPPAKEPTLTSEKKQAEHSNLKPISESRFTGSEDDYYVSRYIKKMKSKEENLQKQRRRSVLVGRSSSEFPGNKTHPVPTASCASVGLRRVSTPVYGMMVRRAVGRHAHMPRELVDYMLVNGAGCYC